ncbi:zinc-RING finger domain-containing protein [Hirsutella rhossiliensis]
MEHALTCNNLKCKKELGDRALVTTCSHIFCLECVRRLGLSTQENPRGAACPACNSQLAKPDDAVFANLNPSEDYKTSILSGLSPNVIMECAGRALSFWAYQTTQQISYQQYLCKTLAEKYSNLKLRLDQTAKDANIELERLRQKLDSSAAEHDGMRRKNEELAQAYRDKSRKLLQTQELYDKAKRKAEMGQIQRAASDAVDSTLLAEPQSQRTAGAFDGYHPQQEPSYRHAFVPYGNGNRLDASGVHSGFFKSNLRHVPSEERWPGQD